MGWVSGTGCHRFTCRLLEGMLEEADKVLVNFEPCVAELKKTETYFHDGVVAWSTGQQSVALRNFGSGLGELAKDVDVCGVKDQIDFVIHEASVFGLANFTVIGGEIISAIVHGEDLAKNIGDGFVAILDGNYRDAGADFGKAMNVLSDWTTGHLCALPICYIVSGVLQYFTDLGHDLKRCEGDFVSEWTNFSAAFHELSGYDDHFEWDKSTKNITAGLLHISGGLHALGSSVKDCHLEELSKILTAMAVKLGLVPEITFVVDMLKIL